MSLLGIAVQLALTDMLAAITAVGVFLTGIGTYLTHRTGKQVHDSVKTSNGQTIAEIVETIATEQVTVAEHLAQKEE